MTALPPGATVRLWMPAALVPRVTVLMAALWPFTTYSWKPSL